MATLTANRAKHATLTANTVDTVTLGWNCSKVIVRNRSTTGWLWIREGGTAPTVAGDDCYPVGPGEAATIDSPSATATIIKVICSTANDYSVIAG